MRRFTRLTNGFSKKIENHLYMLSLYLTHYNFVRIHRTLKGDPAMAAGVSETLRDMEWIVGLIDARATKPRRPATCRQAADFKLRYYPPPPSLASCNRYPANWSYSALDLIPRAGRFFFRSDRCFLRKKYQNEYQQQEKTHYGLGRPAPGGSACFAAPTKNHKKYAIEYQPSLMRPCQSAALIRQEPNQHDYQDGDRRDDNGDPARDSHRQALPSVMQAAPR